MKRFFAVTMAVLMTAALCGCGVVQNPPASTGWRGQYGCDCGVSGYNGGTRRAAGRRSGRA